MSGFNDRPFCGTNNGQNERTKMMKKRLLSHILAALTVSVTLASCVGQTGEDETTAGAETTVGDETPDELVRQLYGERDYGGRKLRILAVGAGAQWYNLIGSEANEVWFEDAGSDLLQKSVYERNKSSEQLLNMEIVPMWCNSSQEVREKVVSAALANIDDFDVSFASLPEQMTAAANGALLNLNDYDSFDGTHSWWNEKFVKNITLFGTDIYVIAGAINIWDDCSIEALIFNKDYIERHGCDDPYQMVFDGEWTIDNQRVLMKQCTADVNGDQDMDDADNWGASGIGIILYSGLYGLDTGITRMNEDGFPELTCTTEEHITKVQSYFNTVMNSDALYQQGINGEKTYYDMFTDGQSALMMANLTSLFGLRNMEDEYGILPLAKYNAEQLDYTGKNNSDFYTCYAVPKSCTDPDFALTALEVMSGYSVDTLDYNLHEILFASKLTRDRESRQVLKILQNTISFDWAYVGDWRGNLVSIYDLKAGWPFTLASRLESEVDSAQARLDNMIEGFAGRSGG